MPELSDCAIFVSGILCYKKYNNSVTAYIFSIIIDLIKNG